MKKNEESFTVNVTGDTSGENFRGVFRTKLRISFRDSLEKDRIRRQMLGDLPEGASIRANSIADIFSDLAIRIIEAPSWWTNSGNGMDLEDENVLGEVYRAAMQAGKEVVKAEEAKAKENKADLAKTVEE